MSRAPADLHNRFKRTFANLARIVPKTLLPAIGKKIPNRFIELIAETINKADSEFDFTVRLLESSHEGNFIDEYTENGNNGVWNVILHNTTYDAQLEDRFLKFQGNNDEDLLHYSSGFKDVKDSRDGVQGITKRN